MARPSEFTQEVATAICEQISTTNKSLKTICEGEGMPSVGTIYNWFKAYPSFLEEYTRAKDQQADLIFEEILEIADTCKEGVRVKTIGEGENAKTETQTGDMVERSKLQVDARKWVAARLAPKRYGDFARNEVSGPDGGPLEIRSIAGLLEKAHGDS